MLPRRLGLTRYVNIDNQLYFYDRRGTGIYKFDKLKSEVSLVLGDKKNVYFKYSDVIQCGNKLVFAPYQAENILIYDLVDKITTEISLPEPGVANRIVKSGDKLFFIRQKNNYIEFDLSKNTYEIIYYNVEAKCSSYVDLCVLNDTVFFPVDREGAVLEVCLPSKKATLHTLNVDMLFGTIAYCDNTFWLTGSNDYIIAWNKEDNSIRKLCIPDGITVRNNIDWKGVFSSSVVIHDKLYFAPLKSDSIMRINPETFEAYAVMKIPKNNVCWCLSQWDADKIYFSLENNNGLEEKEFVIYAGGIVCCEDIMGIYDFDSATVNIETQWDTLRRFIEKI